MTMLFLNEVLFPALGVATVVGVAAVGIVWLFHVIHSISRAADALERIAVVFECGAVSETKQEEDEEEDNEEKGGAV